MSTQIFHIFSNYENDLTRTLDGSYKLYPSRWIAFRGGEVNLTEVQKRMEGNIRYGAYGEMTSPFSTTDVADLIQHTALGDVVAAGDITLQQSEVEAGIAYSEIFIHVDGEKLRRSYIYLPDEPLRETDPIINELLGKPVQQPGVAENNIEFDRIVVLYNLYRKAESETLEDMIVFRDYPLGLLELESTQTLYIDSKFGGGTSWSTRLMSRVATGRAHVETPSTDYHTLTRLLTEVGRSQSKMDEIVKTRIGHLDTFKSYMDRFRNEQSINVPYIIAGRWFVNGKDIGPVVEDYRLAALIKDYIKKHPDEFRGPKGDPGDNGESPELKLDEQGKLWTKLPSEDRWRLLGVLRPTKVGDPVLHSSFIYKPYTEWTGNPFVLSYSLKVWKEWEMSDGSKTQEPIETTVNVDGIVLRTGTHKTRIPAKMDTVTDHHEFTVGAENHSFDVAWKKREEVGFYDFIFIDNTDDPDTVEVWNHYDEVPRKDDDPDVIYVWNHPDEVPPLDRDSIAVAPKKISDEEKTAMRNKIKYHVELLHTNTIPQEWIDEDTRIRSGFGSDAGILIFDGEEGSEKKYHIYKDKGSIEVTYAVWPNIPTTQGVFIKILNAPVVGSELDDPKLVTISPDTTKTNPAIVTFRIVADEGGGYPHTSYDGVNYRDVQPIDSSTTFEIHTLKK